MKLDKNSKILPFILPILIIIVWFLITEIFKIIPLYMLPSPINVFNSAIGMIIDGSLLTNTVSTLTKVFLGIFFAFIIAVPLGIFLGWSEFWNKFASFIISILRPVPPIAWIPFAILWIGIGLNSSVFVIFIGCVFPLLVYTIDGVKRTDKVLIEAAQTLGATDKEILRKIIIPAAVPHIISGLKVGVSIALMCTVSAEMIASSDGLGHMILTASNLFNTGIVVVGILVIGIIGIILDQLFNKYQEKIFW